MKENYKEQTELMLNCLKVMSERSDDFALKGGTAINFFIYDKPRLSIDIDLVYMNKKDNRETAIHNSKKILREISEDIKIDPNSKRVRTNISGEHEVKLNIIELGKKNISIKVEVNCTIRGSCYQPKKRKLSKGVSDEFNIYLEYKVLDLKDLYGSKICAALDRQHPRDLFDIKKFFEKKEISINNLKHSLIFYLLSHRRPIHELLKPELKERFSETYENHFLGMTEEDVSLQSLKDTFHDLITEVNSSLKEEERRFILSFHELQPDWNSFPLKIKDMPSILWKLKNIEKLREENFKKYECFLKTLKEDFMAINK